MKLTLTGIDTIGKNMKTEKAYASMVPNTNEFIKFMIGCGIDLGFDEETLSHLHILYLQEIKKCL